jgi:hypothetical protein
LRIGRPSIAGYGMTSGNTVDPELEPSGLTLAPLSIIGANYAYSNGTLALPGFGIGSIQVVGTMSASITAPKARIRASFRSSAMEFGARITGPKQLVRGHFGFHIRAAAKKATVSASSTGTGLFSMDIVAPRPTVGATGTVSGVFGAKIKAPKATVAGHFGMVCVITAPKASARAAFTSGAVMALRITAPKPVVSEFRMTAEGYFHINITAPKGAMGGTMQARITAPKAAMAAVFSAVVAAVYEAYSINLTHASTDAPVDEVTRYTNFPFTHIVRFQGDYFGVAADGLYQLGGATDDGEPIAYSIKTCSSDFKAPELKTIASAYLAGRIGPLTVTLHAGEDGAESYAYAAPRGPTAKAHREKFGKGAKNRYFALALAGEDEMELDSIELEINKMSRRI